MKATIKKVETGGVQFTTNVLGVPEGGTKRQAVKVSYQVDGKEKVVQMPATTYCQFISQAKGGGSLFNCGTEKLFPGLKEGMEVEVSLE